MAKRISSSSINWGLIVESIREEDKPMLMAFKSKCDKYLRDVTSKPAELPKIDWSYYKSKIAIPGVVDSFQKSYEALSVPAPSDKGLLAAAEKEQKKMAELGVEYEKKSQQVIAEHKEKLAKLAAVLPYSQMSVEEYLIARPDKNFVANPSLWPHWDPDDDDETEKDSSKSGH